MTLLKLMWPMAVRQLHKDGNIRLAFDRLLNGVDMAELREILQDTHRSFDQVLASLVGDLKAFTRLQLLKQCVLTKDRPPINCYGIAHTL